MRHRVPCLLGRLALCAPPLLGIVLLGIALLSPTFVWAQTADAGFVQLRVNREQPRTYFEVLFVGDEQPYLHLDHFMAAVELQISYDPALGEASGFLADGRTRFLLNPRQGIVVIGERTLPLLPGDVRLLEQTLYVRYAALDAWLPLSVRWELDAYLIDVTTDYPLASRQRLLREGLRRELESRRAQAADAEALQRPVPWFDPGMFEVSGIAAGGEPVQPEELALQFRGVQRFLKGDLEYGLSGTWRDGGQTPGSVDYVRLTHHDALRSWETVAGDTYGVFTPLLLDTVALRGFSFRTGGRGTGFGQSTLVGTAPPGSTVDLYRLGVLVDFTAANERGQYRFDNIPVGGYSTTFEIHIETPQGEKLVRVEQVAADARMLPAGGWATRGATGEGQQRPSVFTATGGEVRHGLLPALTLGTHLLKLENYVVYPDLLPEFTSGGVFFLWQPWPWLLFEAEQVQASQVEGRGQRLDALLAFSGALLEVDWRGYDGAFNPPNRDRSADFSTPDQADRVLNVLARSRIAETNLEGTIERTAYGEHRSREQVWLRADRRLGAGLSGQWWAEQLRILEAGLPDVGSDTLGLSGNYRLTPVQRIDATWSTQRQLAGGTVRLWGGTWRKNYREGSPWAWHLGAAGETAQPTHSTAGAGYRFAPNLRLDAQVDSTGAWWLRITAAQPFRVDGDGVSPLPAGTFGSAALEGTVFEDANGNGRRDAGERGVPGVRILTPGIRNLGSDEEGHFEAWGLPVSEPVEVQVDLLSTDALYTPLLPRQHLAARPGERVRLDIPLVNAGGLEGSVTGGMAGGISGAFGLPLRLVRGDGTVAARTVIEFDGSFVFETVPPGVFELQPDEPETWKEAGLRLVPAARPVTMPGAGDPAWLTGFTFRLERAPR